MLAVLNRHTPIEAITPEDFSRLRNELAKRYGPVVLKVSISRIKSIFAWAYESELIEKPVRYGPGFKPPSAKAIRQARLKTGKLTFSPEELRLLIENARQPWKAIVLTALNCGFGNGDIAELPIDAVDLENGWIEFPRPKTSIPRKAWLWPETVEALREVLDSRPAPKDTADANLVFLTSCGERWVRMRQKDDGTFTPIDSISREFPKLLNRLGLKRHRRNFYAIRHTHRTASDGAGDQPASDYIMGHAPSGNDMRAVYVEDIDDARLRAVTEHVRNWLYGPVDEGSRPVLRVVG